MPLPTDESAKHYGAERSSRRGLVKQLVRGLRLAVLCFAVLALSSPRISGPPSSHSPAISSSPVELAAITRATGLYDLSRAPSAIYQWKSDKQKHRPFRQGGSAALAAIGLPIEPQRAGAEHLESRLPETPRHFLAFDARAPPSTF